VWQFSVEKAKGQVAQCRVRTPRRMAAYHVGNGLTSSFRCSKNVILQYVII